jgi:hypothetical protein
MYVIPCTSTAQRAVFNGQGTVPAIQNNRYYWPIHLIITYERFILCVSVSVSVICRSHWPRGLRRESWPVELWDRRFEFRLSHGCMPTALYVVLV